MEKDIIHKAKFWKPNINEDILLYKGHFNTFEFDKHVHEEFTITLVQDGKMNAFLDGFSHDFTKSAILTINPDEIHACKTQTTSGYKYNSIYFKKSFLENIIENKSKDIYFSKQTLNNIELYKKLSMLIYAEEHDLVSNLDFECELVEVMKSITYQNTNLNMYVNMTSHDKLVLKAKEYINDNFSSDLSLDDISSALNISKYHFLRLFKQKTHISPHNYLMLRRIEKAKQSLQNGKSIINTAYECGFNDQSHLNRRFKAITGLTPGSYKNFFH